MLRTAVLSFASVIGVLALACTSSTTGAGASSSSGGSSGSSGSSCTPNTGNGTSACGSAVCQPTTYCSDSFLSDCKNGCTATNNCGSGQFCDLSNAQQDERGAKVGTCQSCTPSSSSSSGSTSGGACGQYAGAYHFVQAAGSASQCSDLQSQFLGSGAECNFVQTDCKMSQSCGNSGNLQFTIDASNKGQSTTNVTSSQGSGSIVCSYQFEGEGTLKSVTMNCQITGTGGSLNCNYDGTLN